MEREDRQVSERPRARSGRSRVVRALAGGLLAVGLVALGVAAGVWGERRNAGGGSANPAPQNASPPQEGAAMPGMSAPPAAALSSADPPGDVEVVLSADALAKIGIKTSTIAAVDASASVQVPGSVMPNAYREVKVTPIVGGIVTKVPVGLGDPVRRGDPVVVLFSAELADAQTKYLSMAAIERYLVCASASSALNSTTTGSPRRTVSPSPTGTLVTIPPTIGVTFTSR